MERDSPFGFAYTAAACLAEDQKDKLLSSQSAQHCNALSKGSARDVRHHFFSFASIHIHTYIWSALSNYHNYDDCST